MRAFSQSERDEGFFVAKLEISDALFDDAISGLNPDKIDWTTQYC